MPIELFTGLPGASKTAFLVDRIIEEGEKENPRPLVAMGINGLQPGLATVLDNPTRWAEITDREQGDCTCPLIGGEPLEETGTFQPHTHRIPRGAIVFIDEAWKWFGHLHDAGRQSTPRHVLDLAEHRHMGIDFIWTTQGPNQIYPFARNLIADHMHIVRKFRTQIVDVYKWGELQEDVKSDARRAQALHEVKGIPKRAFGKYKSSEEHTIKARIPWKVALIPVCIVGALIAAWLAYVNLRPSTVSANVAGAMNPGLPGSSPTVAAVPADVRRENVTALDKHRPEAQDEYYAAMRPRNAVLPWSAPLFDERPAVADPRLFCMESGAGLGADGVHRAGSYTCITEQGSRVVLTEPQAKLLARWGEPYNPYKQPLEQPREASTLSALVPEATAAVEPRPRVVLGSVGTVGRPAVDPTFGTITRPIP